MSKPSNPYEIIIKNIFFKDGLTAGQIFNYWIKNKNNILNNINSDQKIICYISTNENSHVVRRYTESKNPFFLNVDNYEKILNGRTVGILKTITASETIGIIDIDTKKNNDIISSENDFNETKNVAKEVYDYFSRLYNCQILYTGKNGFHIYCKFPNKMQIIRIKEILEKQIKGSPLTKIASFQNKRTDLFPNIDLSPNIANHAAIIPFSLNKIGLPSVFVPRSKIDTFLRSSLITEVLSNA